MACVIMLSLACCPLLLLPLQVLKAPHFTIGHIGSMGRGKCHAEMSADARFVAAGAADGQVRHTKNDGKLQPLSGMHGWMVDPLAEPTNAARALLGLLDGGLCLCSATSAVTCIAISSHSTLGAYVLLQCCMH